MYEIDTTHYVARIVIERVDHLREPAKQYVQSDVAKPAGRKVTELTSITLRNDDLPKLVDRVTQHLGLIEDITAVDERPKSGLRRGND